MDKLYGYYPLGFRRVQTDGIRKLEKKADDRVTAEWARWQENRAAIRSWPDRAATVDLAVELFGDIRKWLVEQQQNPDITLQGWWFLKETIHFINTGHRFVSIPTHTGLILREVAENRTYPIKDRKDRLVDMLKVEGEEPIARWLRHPDGYADLLGSLTVFFGNTQLTGAVTWAN